MKINEITQEEREDILYNDWIDFVYALKNNEAYTAIIELEKYLKLGGSKDKARKQVLPREDWFKKSLTRTAEFLNIGFFEKTVSALKLLGFDWPEMDIANHKDTIIKEFLSRLRRGNNPGLDKVEALRKLGYNWPELAVIERSLKADKTIAIGEMITGARLSQTYQKLIRSIKSKKYDQAESIVINDLTSEKWSDIFFKLGKKLSRQELAPFLTHMKDQIVRLMLSYFKEGMRFEVQLMSATLRNAGLNWPELAVIDRSLRAELGKADDTLDEDLREMPKESHGQLLRALLSAISEHDSETATEIFMSFSRFWMLGQVLEYILRHISDKADAKWFFDLQKKPIMFHVLEEIKEAADSDYPKQLVKLLQKARVDWPELAIIQRSMDADRAINKSNNAED